MRTPHLSTKRYGSEDALQHAAFREVPAADVFIHYREQTSAARTSESGIHRNLRATCRHPENRKKTEHTVGESRSGFQYGSVNRGPRHLLPIVSLIATIVRRMTRTGCIAATYRTDKAMCLSGQGFPKGSRSSEHCTRDRIQRYSLYQDTDDCVSLPSVS